MIIKNINLETVCGITSKLPENDKPEIAFAGKSNVGKSSLINALMNRKSFARISATPGKTQTINFYNINDALYLVDLPGYGYAKVSQQEKEKWGKMIERYLHSSKQLRAVFLLIDIRHEPSANDKMMYDWVVSQGYNPIIIATKQDKLKRSQIDKHVKMLRQGLKLVPGTRIIPFSSVTKQGRDEIWELVETELLDRERVREVEKMGRNEGTAAKDNRPYWKVIVSLAFSLVGTILFIYVGVKALFYFMPFVIGWFLSFIASPLVVFLEKRLKIIKKLGSAIIIIAVLAACIGLIYLAVSRIWGEVSSLIQDFPSMYRDLEKGFRQIGERTSQIFALLPGNVQEGLNTFAANLDETMSGIISSISEPTVAAAGNFAKRIPSILISFIVTIISAYFFIADRENIILWAKKIFPKPIVERMTMVTDNLKYAVGGYFKAQFKIMAVVFAILLVGFGIMGVHFSVLLAIGIAFLDFLPFFGTGTALLPWALYELLTGDYRRVVALAVLYAVTQLVRQLIQPKLVGDSMGLNPLFTLVLLYAGYRAGGILWMILAVPIGLLVVNLYKAGAFDYILDDVRILADGVLSLRRPEPAGPAEEKESEDGK